MEVFDNGLNLSARYRYNTVNDSHSDRELDGSGYTRRQSHQFDIWFAYNIGKFGMSYNPRFRWQDGVDQERVMIRIGSIPWRSIINWTMAGPRMLS